MALLETYPTWSLNSIVAITFTEKAAREMRDRVRQAISQRIYTSPNATQMAFWRRHEDSLESARIGTIHALAAQLLRANPVEAALDPGFQILDEVEATLLQDEAVEQALVALIDTPAAALLADYGVRTVRDVLKAFINRTAAQPFLEALANKSHHEWLQQWQQLQEADTSAMLSSIRADHALRNAMAWVNDKGEPADDALWTSWRIALSQYAIILNGDWIAVFNALTTLKDTITARGGSKKFWGDEETVKESRKQLQHIRKLAKSYLNQFIPPIAENDQQALYVMGWWYEAIGLATQTYTHLKTVQNVLDFDDLEALTVELLENHPLVAAHYVQYEFNHIMVDEFQDTNDAQRRIVYALCGIDAENAPSGRLFVVGDPKQSIYAFRGADVSVFDRVHHELLQRQGESVALSKSFRSHQHLVDTYNSLFSIILHREQSPVGAFTVGYEPVTHHRETPPSLQNPVTLIGLHQPKTDDKSNKLASDDFDLWEAMQVGQQLQAMVNNQTLIWERQTDTQRRLDYGDIAILFQSMTKTPLWERAFQQLGLPYMTIAGKGYFERQEVWDVQNLLATLHNPTDNLAVAAVLRSPIFGLSDDALLAYRLQKDVEGKPLPLWQALMNTHPPLEVTDAEVAEFAQQTLAFLHRLAGRVTIAELIEQALELTAFEATLTALPNGERRRANIKKLLTVAHRSQRVSLAEFQVYLRDMVSTEAREGEATLEAEGSITLMSVHKSKGLEFPVVVIGDASWSRDDYKPTLVFDPLVGPVCKIMGTEDVEEPSAYQLAIKYQRQRAEAERKRLFYVAATRAQDYLIISGEYKQSGWMGYLREVLSLPSNDDVLVGESALPAWGIQLQIPAAPARKDLHQRRAIRSGWTHIQHNEPPATSPLPLLQPLHIEIPGKRWHINATDLERLEDPSLQHKSSAFRRRVMGDTPAPIRPLVHGVNEKPAMAYVIGNVVHRALKVGLLPSQTTRDQFDYGLKTYAWEHGVIEPYQHEYAVAEARRLLQQYEKSKLGQILHHADPIFREYEFTYQHGSYIIHGIIDLLFYHEDRWHVLDFKTNRIITQNAPTFSQRFRYQMGAYAQAVEAYIGAVPQVWLYYLHPNYMYEMTESEWRGAMGDIEAVLNGVLANEGAR